MTITSFFFPWLAVINYSTSNQQRRDCCVSLFISMLKKLCSQYAWVTTVEHEALFSSWTEEEIGMGITEHKQRRTTKCRSVEPPNVVERRRKSHWHSELKHISSMLGQCSDSDPREENISRGPRASESNVYKWRDVQQSTAIRRKLTEFRKLWEFS